MARKTADVQAIKQKANHYLASERFTTAEMRAGVASLLEVILHDTGNYKGFRYLDGAEGDQTRRAYY